MKQLQYNFTSPEQSKRLLELGVPADSADMHMSYASKQTYSSPQWNDVRVTAYQSYFPTLDIIPCWSVGRLIEILCICKKGEEVSFYTWTDKIDLVEWIIYKIEEAEPDFSKLEN